jgi:uncharacterized sulfatase
LLVRWPGVIAPGTQRSEPVGLIDLGPTMLAATRLPVPEHLHGRPLFDANGQFTQPQPYIFGHRDRMGPDEDTIRTVRDQRFRYIRNYHPDRPHFFYSEYDKEFSTVRELRLFENLESFIRQFGGTPDALDDAQRQFLAQTKPAEELYDVRADPHEIRNLASDPAFGGELSRLRDAVDRWQETYGDLGLIPERELVGRWRANGITSTTEAPVVEILHDRVVATCATGGASITWTADPPPDAPARAPSASDAAARLLNSFSGLPSTVALPDADPQEGHETEQRRSCRLYRGPFAPPEGPIWFRACRIGYEDSPEVTHYS